MTQNKLKIGDFIFWREGHAQFHPNWIPSNGQIIEHLGQVCRIETYSGIGTLTEIKEIFLDRRDEEKFCLLPRIYRIANKNELLEILQYFLER